MIVARAVHATAPVRALIYVLLFFLVYVLLLALYTYAEVAVFHEAYHAAQRIGIAPRTVNEARQPLPNFKDLMTRADAIALPPAR